MSSLLEQAIIDANDLRSAALKSAETAILERYSTEVKSAVDSLLEEEFPPEEEEDPLAPGGLSPEEAFGAGIATSEEEALGRAVVGEPDALATDPVAAVPIAAAALAPLCPCPDDDEKQTVEFTLEDLLQHQEDMPMGDPVPNEALAAAFGAPPGAEELSDEDELLGMISEELTQIEDDDIELEISEEDIREIIEQVVSDTAGTPTGWDAVHPGGSTAEGVLEYERDLEEAGQSDEEKLEEDPEKEALYYRLAESYERIQELEQNSQAFVESNKELKAILYRLKGKLEEVNLSNAQLLYTNRILNSPSLNERQKSKIVESIQKADSIEEAKVICETLQSAVGTSKKQPKSLNEVIRRPSTTMPRRRNANSKREIVAKDRFQKLAGIT